MSTFILFFLLSQNRCEASMGQLMGIARAQEDAQKTYAQETKTFKLVKDAIDRGDIRKGQSKGEIEGRYGDPVVKIPEYGTGRERWIYKPAKSSFFAGVKAYIYFDKNSNIDEIKIVE